ncbi:hypothetical protein CC2G_007943 [Coprinopsis cinerea AmutBmut pab1-1]|nr:hypothetical protein CC2G_007943 [Coprinopsis cinerea AmutBmut pab1-1]
MEIAAGVIGAAGTVAGVAQTFASGFSARHDQAHDAQVAVVNQINALFMKAYREGEILEEDYERFQVQKLRVHDLAAAYFDAICTFKKTQKFSVQQKLKAKDHVRDCKRKLREGVQELQMISNNSESSKRLQPVSAMATAGSVYHAGPFGRDGIQEWAAGVYGEKPFFAGDIEEWARNVLVDQRGRHADVNHGYTDELRTNDRRLFDQPFRIPDPTLRVGAQQRLPPVPEPSGSRWWFFVSRFTLVPGPAFEVEAFPVVQHDADVWKLDIIARSTSRAPYTYHPPEHYVFAFQYATRHRIQAKSPATSRQVKLHQPRWTDGREWHAKYQMSFQGLVLRMAFSSSSPSEESKMLHSPTFSFPPPPSPSGFVMVNVATCCEAHGLQGTQYQVSRGASREVFKAALKFKGGGGRRMRSEMGGEREEEGTNGEFCLYFRDPAGRVDPKPVTEGEWLELMVGYEGGPLDMVVVVDGCKTTSSW